MKYRYAQVNGIEAIHQTSNENTYHWISLIEQQWNHQAFELVAVWPEKGWNADWDDCLDVRD